MAQSVGDFFWERLHTCGVRTVFGRRHQRTLGAMNRADGKIELIQVWHEEMAAFMASAYAKFSGKLGVASRHPVPAHRI